VQRDFVQLLNRCLSAKAYALGLRYDKDYRCHYFKATNDLSDLKLGYKSLTNDTTRTVFRGYPKKSNPKEIAYYRHSAFEGRFKRFEDAWSLEITPTYHFTRDGRWPSAFYDDKLTGIKQLARRRADVDLRRLTAAAAYLRALLPKRKRVKRRRCTTRLGARRCRG
jgi:hypothetical protein